MQQPNMRSVHPFIRNHRWHEHAIQKWPISSMGLGRTFTGCCTVSLEEMGNFISVKPMSFWLIDDCLYSAILSSWADSLRSHVILHEWLAFYSAFLNIHRSGVLTALTWLVPYETAAVSAQVLCTPCNHAPCHFMQSHIRKVYACLAVTCHLHFWQNDRDLLLATAVTRGWNVYQNKSQHRKLTLEKKILPPFLQGFEPTTFQSQVHSNHWAIPAPCHVCSALAQVMGHR